MAEMFVLNIFCGWGGHFPHSVAHWFYQCSANDRTPYIRDRKVWNACGLFAGFSLCSNAALGVLHCFTLRSSACGAPKSPLHTLFRG